MMTQASRKGDEPGKVVERTDFSSCPRYEKHELSEEQIIEIAKKAVLLAKDEFYLEVGRTIFQRFLWFLGAAAAGLYFWLRETGKLPTKM